MKKNAPTAGWNQPVVADEPHIGVRQKYSAKRAMKKTINQNQGPVTSRKRLLKRHNQPVGKVSMFQKVKLAICKNFLRTKSNFFVVNRLNWLKMQSMSMKSKMITSGPSSQVQKKQF